VKTPPETSPTEGPLVRGSKIKAPSAAGGGPGVGALPPVLPVVGGVGVDAPPKVPTDEPSFGWVKTEVPVSGFTGSSRLHPATHAVANRRSTRQRFFADGVGKVRFYLSGTINGLSPGDRISEIYS
jgi:hypothetical protein